ncbi:hypothetical protein BOTBODRAFT_494893 [Botryobasidium botryosum FD-172 SS1]|uniref:VASt domain-containing protein n=1 Tax=Botryobasidium botryosum (strain FD-172 SS1) TaxID=930990 RepID=A0A067M3P6_BOTB1|nr:hypothetical protein BOTBODRAFT_494893 [Botryobasidium botryosum FD-172 SS1]
MTAFVIPNAIQVTTRETKYAFASFLSRDTAFDVIYNIWRLACPDPLGSGVGSSASVGFAPSVALTAGSAGLAPTAGSGGGPGAGGGTGGAEVAGLGLATGAGKKQQHRATTCRCEAHLEETVMDCVLPGSPERIYNLMFASGFIKNFMAGEQKLTEIQISDWRPEKTGSHLLTRNMSYIKPLTGTFGPRQAKCELTEETLYVDFDDYVCTLTTTRTPEVPSGGVFAVKTRTCIMWAGGMSSRVLVTTAVEWTGRSFVKSIIERSALDGQRTYHADLEASMRAYVLAHRTEFFPDGEDEETAATVENATSPTAEDTSFQSPSAGGGARTPADDKRARLKETEQRGLQWALDTATGTARVAHNSFWGAIDLLGDLFESVVSTGAGAGSSTPGVGAVLGMLSSVWAWVVIVLVVSNVWMVVSLRGANKRETKAWRWARLEKAIVETRAPAEFPPGMANPVGNEVPPLGPGGGAAPVAGGGAVPTEAVRVLLEELVAAKQRAAPEHWSAILGEEKTCVKDEVVRLRHTLDAIEGQVRRLRDTLPLPGTMMDCVD